MLTEPCPCESGQSYQTCCYPLHEGALANNATTLMRSRYTAYVFSLAQYLLDTWHIDTRPDTLNLEEDAITKWLGLSIKRFEQPSDTSAIVEFVARYMKSVSLYSPTVGIMCLASLNSDCLETSNSH